MHNEIYVFAKVTAVPIWVIAHVCLEMHTVAEFLFTSEQIAPFFGLEYSKQMKVAKDVFFYFSFKRQAIKKLARASKSFNLVLS